MITTADSFRVCSLSSAETASNSTCLSLIPSSGGATTGRDRSFSLDMTTLFWRFPDEKNH